MRWIAAILKTGEAFLEERPRARRAMRRERLQLANI